MAQTPRDPNAGETYDLPDMEGRRSLWNGSGMPTVMVNSQGSKENVFQWYGETPTETIEDLMKGATDGSDGDYAKACKERGGSIRGLGPACDADKEEGEYDVARCFYEGTLQCIQKLRYKLLDCSTQFYQVMRNNSTGGGGADRSLTPARQCYVDGQNEYVECKEKLPNDCECKSCFTTFGPPPTTDDDTDTDTPVVPPVDPGITPKNNTLTTTSNNGPIHRLWGRYVLPGNIIWIGEKTTKVSTRYLGDTPRQRLDVVSDDTYTEFFLGVCAGEASAMLRIFFGDHLVYNKLIDLTNLDNTVATDLDLSLLASSPEDMAFLNESRPQFTLYKGSSAQKINKAQVKQEGFGKSPAYRDLVYIHFSNIDLRLLGGSMPEIRVDLASVIDESQNPYVETVSHDDIVATELTVDLRTNAVSFYEAENMLTTLDWSDLSWRASLMIDEDRKYFPSSYGKIGARDASGWPVRINMYDPITGLELGGFGSEFGGAYVPEFATRANGSIMAKTFKGYTATLEPRDYIPYTTPDGSFAAVTFDPSREQVIAENVFNNTTSHVPIGDALVTVNRDLHYLTFMYPSGSKTNMKVQWMRVRGGNVNQLAPFLYDEFNPEQSAGNYGEYQLSNTLAWGGGTSNVTLKNAVVTNDNCVLLFFRVGSAYRITKLNPAAQSAVWTVTIPYEFGYFSGTGECGGKQVTNEFRFIDNDNVLVSVNTITGELLPVATMTELNLPDTAEDRAQYYDPRTNSMTYISADNRVVRAFFERLQPAVVTLKTIIDASVRAAGLPRGFINTDALAAISLLGYAVTETKTLRQILEEMSEFYQFAIVDTGGSLTLTFKSAMDDVISLDPDMDVTNDPVSVSYVAPGSRVDSIEASFYTIGEQGMEESIQTVSLRGDDVLKAPNTLQVSSRIYDDPLNIRKQMELALEVARSGQNSFEATLMPRAMAVTVHDQVEYKDKKYLIAESLFSPENVTALQGFASIADKLDDFADITAVTLFNKVEVDRRRIGRDIKPVVLFTNALNNEDASQAQTRQVAYALIESSAPEFDPTRVRCSINQHMGRNITIAYDPSSDSTFVVPQSPVYSSLPISKAAHMGSLITAPYAVSTTVFNPDSGLDEEVQIKPTRWTSDSTDSLTVRFTRADTIALLENIEAPYYSVQETPNKNLLIVGREYIQFGTFTVDEDDPLLVTFTNLFRGTLGTEPYMTHEEGERVYFYTPDTVVTILVEGRYTKRRAPARVYINEALPAGAIQADYVYTSDAGSMRPWAPTDIEFYYHDILDSDGNTVKELKVALKRRYPFIVDFNESVGDLPDQTGLGSFVLDTNNALYNLPEFEAAYMDVSSTIIQTLEDDVPSPKYIFWKAPILPTDDVLVAIVAQLGLDEDGKRVVGHPAFVRFYPQYVNTYPTA